MSARARTGREAAACLPNVRKSSLMPKWERRYFGGRGTHTSFEKAAARGRFDLGARGELLTGANLQRLRCVILATVGRQFHTY